MEEDKPYNPWVPITSPLELKLIGKTLEELGELSSALSRCLIQGINEEHPESGKPNTAWVEDEIADVRACLNSLIFHLNLDEKVIAKRDWLKHQKLETWINN